METTGTLDLIKVFQTCPIIYGVLIAMSCFSLVIWLYSLMSLRLHDMLPDELVMNVRSLLLRKQYEDASVACQQSGSFGANIMNAGIVSIKHGPQVMMDAMMAEGRRRGGSLWQRVSLLNEIAVVAPMIGLLGTVVGLFFAFYDNTHTAESMASIFDGLGIAIGTTVVGLIVSIMAMIFFTTLKFRVVNLLNTIENESLALVTLVENDNQ